MGLDDAWFSCESQSDTDVAAECADVNPDEIAAREQTMVQDLAALRERLMETRDVLAEARRAFEDIGENDRAARAAADRQSVLSELQQIAEDYVSVRTGVVLLQWTVERYRREKQAPLLKRSGVLFAKLTGGSFKELKIEFGEQDKMHPAGVRSDDTIVPVSGMSDGTADQLYLVLKVAAVEDSLNHGIPLPFVADDLFINFDGPVGSGIRSASRTRTQDSGAFFHPSRAPCADRAASHRGGCPGYHAGSRGAASY